MMSVMPMAIDIYSLILLRSGDKGSVAPAMKRREQKTIQRALANAMANVRAVSWGPGA
jgi:hypothetical protein